jgi:hypothetical protein
MPDTDFVRYITKARVGLTKLLNERYGRDSDSDIDERGYRVSLREAGYATGGAWMYLQAARWPKAAPVEWSTSFRALDLETRLDLLLKDILEHPEDPADDRWARRYGYGSPSAAARAFRSWYRLDLGEARRIGKVGRWLALASRTPHSSAGLARLEEARRRVNALERHLNAQGNLGCHGRRALRRLGRQLSAETAGGRPRYPPIGYAESQRLRHSGLLPNPRSSGWTSE